MNIGYAPNHVGEHHQVALVVLSVHPAPGRGWFFTIGRLYNGYVGILFTIKNVCEGNLWIYNEQEGKPRLPFKTHMLYRTVQYELREGHPRRSAKLMALRDYIFNIDYSYHIKTKKEF